MIDTVANLMRGYPCLRQETSNQPRYSRGGVPPTTLPVHQAGQSPLVRQDPGHHLEYQGAELTQVHPDTWDRDIILRYGIVYVTVQVQMLRQ